MEYVLVALVTRGGQGLAATAQISIFETRGDIALGLLAPLLAHGWRLQQTTAFAGGRTLFLLANAVFEVRAEGESLADVALELRAAARRLDPCAA